MASYGSTAVELSEENSGCLGVSQDDSEVSIMLANALRKMDGLIGDYSPQLSGNPLPRDPLAVSIVTQCETLKALVMEWEEKVQHTEQLQRQIITMAKEADQAAQRVQVLTSQLAEVQLRARESEAQSEMLSQQLQTTRQHLESREAEITLLSREREVWPSISHDLLQASDSQINRSTMGTSFQRRDSQRRSLKKTFAKAFSRKKTPVVTGNEDSDSAPHIINLRASAFHMKDGHQLGEWMEGIGLEMYRQLVEANVLSGDRLVAMTTKQHCRSDLVRIGIVNTLHCKKLRLAVEEATMATPTPLEGLGHDWVAEWLRLIGLPGYVRIFAEARIDGRMLNSISMSDLDLLGVCDPFHLLSLRRAIQAFRMCGYSPNYLKDPAAASQGSQRLLHWTAQDVKNWLWNINLDQYIGALDNVGFHGAVMLLEVRFNSESLARLLGIGSSQILIFKHLTKNFMELLGPVAAQKKLDAMQTKNFQCIIPTEKGKDKGRGKPRRGREEEETLLCPLDEFPAVLEPTHLTARPFSSLPLSSSPISRHSS